MIEYKNEDIRALQYLVEASQKTYITYNEGIKLYGLGRSRFRSLAEEAKAVRKIGSRVIVNAKVLNDYIEEIYGGAQ